MTHPSRNRADIKERSKAGNSEKKANSEDTTPTHTSERSNRSQEAVGRSRDGSSTSMRVLHLDHRNQRAVTGLASSSRQTRARSDVEINLEALTYYPEKESGQGAASKAPLQRDRDPSKGTEVAPIVQPEAAERMPMNRISRFRRRKLHRG